MPGRVRSQHSIDLNVGKTGFAVITFDCYGTLIDWESGIREAFRDVMRKRGHRPVSATKLLEIYDQEERKVEEEEPFRSYREVQSLAVGALGREVGWNIADTNLLSKALPKWKPFPDTNLALERLARRHALGILSNVDNDLLAATLTHFTIPFQIIVTAEQVRSYKPRSAHFEEARKIIGGKSWLHAAGSLHHDIEPAAKLGIPAVWVNRKREKLSHKSLKQTVKGVRDLTELADWLQA